MSCLCSVLGLNAAIIGPIDSLPPTESTTQLRINLNLLCDLANFSQGLSRMDRPTLSTLG